ncbi:MAG TPA: 4a-hydroxytetrahydrobiopterin dehydratase [Egibacteraceae bacterium]
MTDRLNPDAIHHALDRLDGWNGGEEKLSKTYRFADFAEAMRFTNRVAEVAEEIGHHPDITIRWNEVRLDLTTHSAGGVTQADLDLAATLDGLDTA